MALEDFALASIAHKIFVRENRALGVAGRARRVNYHARIVLVEVGGQVGSVGRIFVAEGRDVILNDVKLLLERQRLVSEQMFDAGVLNDVSSLSRTELKIYRNVDCTQRSRREVCVNKFQTVARKNSDAVALTNAKFVKAVAIFLYSLLELRVSYPPPLVDDGNVLLAPVVYNFMNQQISCSPFFS